MAKDEIWYNGEYYHSIWRDQEEYVQAILSEDGQTARIVWEKKSEWKYLGSESFNTLTTNYIIGESSILFYSLTTKGSSDIPVTYTLDVWLANFANGKFTFRAFSLPIDNPFIGSNRFNMGWYYNGYYYLTNFNSLLNNNTVFKINAYTGDSEIKTDYQVMMYLNNVVIDIVNRYRHVISGDTTLFQYFHQRNLGVLTIGIRRGTSGYPGSTIVFKTEDFSHYYAANIYEDAANNSYCQTIFPWPLNKSSLNPQSYLGCDKGWIAYVSSNPYDYHSGTSSTKPGYYEYAECNLCYTEDFENYEIIDNVTDYIIEHLHTGGAISSIRFKEVSTDPWTTVYIREPDGIYDTLADAIGFDNQTSMDLQNSYGVWIGEHDVFKGVYQDSIPQSSPHTGLILAENIYDVVDEYKSESPEPYVAGTSLIAIEQNNYIYIVLFVGPMQNDTLYFYCIDI